MYHFEASCRSLNFEGTDAKTGMRVPAPSSL